MHHKLLKKPVTQIFLKQIVSESNKSEGSKISDICTIRAFGDGLTLSSALVSPVLNKSSLT